MRPWIRSLWICLPFEMSKNRFPAIFRLWYMQSDAFPVKNHSSIVPSLQNIKNTQLLMMFMTIMSFPKTVQNQFWPVLKYVKNYAEFESAGNFAWNLLKWHVFDNFHFWHFLYFCIFWYFGGRRHEALAFKSAPCPLAHQCVLDGRRLLLKCAEKLMFGCCLVQLTSLTGRLLGF